MLTRPGAAAPRPAALARLQVWRVAARPAHGRASASDREPVVPTNLPSRVTKSYLKKLPKAELGKVLESKGLDTQGLKEELIDRIYNHEAAAHGKGQAVKQPAVSPNAPEPEPMPVALVETDNWAQEVATLRAQLAAQDEAIGTMNKRLAAVDAARSSERAEIAELAGFIGTLQMEVEGEAGALAALAARAGELEEGRAALVALREQQEAMDERVARMQLLLLARDDEIAALKVQLAEFQPLAEAVAGARAGVGMTSGVQELARTGLADVPAWGRGLASGSALHVQPTETQLRPFWAAAGSNSSAPVGLDADPADIVPASFISSNGSQAAAISIVKRHTAPGLLLAAGAIGLGRAWADVKRAVPKERRAALDVVAAVIAAAVVLQVGL